MKLLTHVCSCCGGRTRRAIRRFPSLGTEDRRCQRCADRAFWAEQITDRRVS